MSLVPTRWACCRWPACVRIVVPRDLCDARKIGITRDIDFTPDKFNYTAPAHPRVLLINPHGTRRTRVFRNNTPLYYIICSNGRCNYEIVVILRHGKIAAQAIGIVFRRQPLFIIPQRANGYAEFKMHSGCVIQIAHIYLQYLLPPFFDVNFTSRCIFPIADV